MAAQDLRQNIPGINAKELLQWVIYPAVEALGLLRTRMKEGKTVAILSIWRCLMLSHFV